MRLRCFAAVLSLVFGALALHLTRGVAQPPAAAAKRASAEAARRAQVLASFGGGQLTLADVEDAIANKSGLTRASIAAGDGRARFLEEMVRYELLVREAERRGFATHPGVIDAMRQASIADVQARPEGKPPAIDTRSVAAYFAEHRPLFQHGEQRRASYIELASEAEAKSAIGELRGADRERFAQFAREHSRDQRSQKQGGELGYFERSGKQGAGMTTPPAPLVAAAFALERIGDVSAKPIALDDGFGLLMLTAKVPAADRRLSQVAEQIRQQLSEQERARQFEALVARLRAEIKPEVHPELLAAIVLDPMTPPDIPHGFEAAPADPRAPPRFVKPDGF